MFYIHRKLWCDFVKFEYSFNKLILFHFTLLFDTGIIKKLEVSQLQSAEWPYSALNGHIVELNTSFKMTSPSTRLCWKSEIYVIPIKIIDKKTANSIQIHYMAISKGTLIFSIIYLQQSRFLNKFIFHFTFRNEQ